MCSKFGEGNGTPLQYSFLENPMGGGAWWSAVHGVAKSWTRLQFHFSLSCTGERNGSPLQCSCLENPRDRGAWWAAVYGVAQSRTRLKRLSSSSSSSNYLMFAKGKVFQNYPFFAFPNYQLQSYFYITTALVSSVCMLSRYSHV